MALRTNPEFMLMVATKEPFNENASFNRDIRQLLLAAVNQGDGRIAIVDSTFEQFSNFFLSVDLRHQKMSFSKHLRR
jgi:uncharacterized NAD(P)/FAD-binding protein YdhS